MTTRQATIRNGALALSALAVMLLAWSSLSLLAAETDSPPAPTAPAEAEPTYVGMATCAACHAKVAEGWTTGAHGKALISPDLPKEQQGCEGCHGAGSAHVGSMGKKPIAQPMKDAAQAEAACARCHEREEAVKKPSTEGGATEPKPWPNLNARDWGRTLHARRGISCTACHKLHGGTDRALRQPAGELCLSCHKSLINEKADGYTHSPVAKAQCLLCHLPHGGPGRHSLVAKPSSTCLTCHPAGETLQKPHGEYAVAESDCMSCHNPHSFDRDRKLIRKTEHAAFAPRKCEICHKPSEGTAPPALIKSQKELCLSCHPADKVIPAKGSDGKPLVQHPPAKQGLCTSCHSPHASDREHQLRDRTDQLCFPCHSKVAAQTELPKQHKPVTTGDCMLCHKPHVSPNDSLLTQTPAKQCEPCHTTQGKFSHPVVVRNDKPLLSPVTGKLLVCASCHDIHGSKLQYLLPNEEGALCRSCHKF